MMINNGVWGFTQFSEKSTWTCVKHQHPEAFVERRKQMLEETAAWRMLEGNLWRFSQVLFGSPVGTCWDLAVCRFPKICCGGSWNRCQGESPCWQDYLKALLMLPAVIQARSWTDFLLLGLAKGSRGARISQFSTLQEMQQWSKKQVVQEWNNHFSILKSPYFPQFFAIFSPLFSHFSPFSPL